MPVSRTISSYFAMSSAIAAPNACGVPARASMPSFARLARNSGDCSALLTAALSFSTTASGVPAGASSP